MVERETPANSEPQAGEELGVAPKSHDLLVRTGYGEVGQKSENLNVPVANTEHLE
jgi:hypothetical protein